MRRRRRQMRPDTFPFLAVLLCAMGSLLLLLVVMDRRAKAVARAKALQAAAARSAESAERDAAALREQAEREEEWQQRRQALHDALAGQEEELRNQAAALQRQLEDVDGQVWREEAKGESLRRDLEAERQRLGAAETGTAAARESVVQAEKLTEAARARAAALARELTQLEQTLAELKAARERAQHTFSVVPYRGRRGENRRPLYVECAASGLVFHPDKLAVSMTSAAEVRSEVERRVARQRAALPGETPAYLLFLIRPNGIVTYYEALTALDGLKVEFGYEFIDPDWILDFPANDATPAQPWMAGTTPPAGKAPVVVGKPSPGITGFGVVGGRESAGSAGDPAAPRGGPPAPVGGSATTGGGGGAATANGAGGTPGAPVPVGSTPAAGGTGQGQPGPVISGSGPPTGAGGGATTANGTGGTSGAPVPVGGSPAGKGTGQGQPGPALAASGPPPTGPGGGSSAPDTAGRPPGTGGVAGNASGALPPVPQYPGEAGAPQGAQPPAGAVAGSGEPGSSPQQGTPGTGEAAGASSGPSQPGGGVLDKVATRNPRDGPARPALPKGKPSRDWVLSVECRANALVLYPSGQRIEAAPLATSSQAGRAFAQAVQDLIARRQATVRPGDPPYRPQIRFLVRPTGLRTYYLAYPLLEPLQVPMSRQNLDEGQEIK
jgi:hypothetical protein